MVNKYCVLFYVFVCLFCFQNHFLCNINMKNPLRLRICNTNVPANSQLLTLPNSDRLTDRSQMQRYVKDSSAVGKRRRQSRCLRRRGRRRRRRWPKKTRFCFCAEGIHTEKFSQLLLHVLFTFSDPEHPPLAPSFAHPLARSLGGFWPRRFFGLYHFN